MSSKLTSRERFPELYTPKSSHTDPYTRTRNVPMQVLCLGMPRTGTVSMWTVLQQLGYKDCYHMLNLFTNPPDVDMWMEATNAQFYGKGKEFGRPEWDRLLGNCQAVCDLPCVAFAASLIASYPEAKVILTVRDVDGWYNSMMKSVIPVSRSRLMGLLRYLDPDFVGRWVPVVGAVMGGFFGGEFEEVGKRKFFEHNEMVRNLVPKERLLEYRVGEGWGRLCSFLDISVPEYEFPVTNVGDTFRERMNLVMTLAMRRAVVRTLPLLVGILVVCVAVWFYRNG